MGRDPRFILPNSLQHVVDVISQKRYLLSPSPLINERYLGVLGKAQEKYGMVICAAVVASNHSHLLLRPRDGKHLADFMCFLKTNLAKEIGGRLRGWKGHFFDQRYHSTTVSDEDAAQVRVLRYVLGHGPKECLVDTVAQWPGVHSAESLINGVPMVGRWYDRSAEYVAHDLHGKTETDPDEFASEQIVTLSPLPCWEHLATTAWRQAVKDMVEDIDLEAASERRRCGKTSLGIAKVLAQDPYERPNRVEKSPQSRFHAADRRVLEAMINAWREVIAAFYAASEALRSGNRSVAFPEGTFPPALPFIPFTSNVQNARGHPS